MTRNNRKPHLFVLLSVAILGVALLFLASSLRGVDTAVHDGVKFSKQGRRRLPCSAADRARGKAGCGSSGNSLAPPTLEEPENPSMDPLSNEASSDNTGNDKVWKTTKRKGKNDDNAHKHMADRDEVERHDPKKSSRYDANSRSRYRIHRNRAKNSGQGRGYYDSKNRNKANIKPKQTAGDKLSDARKKYLRKKKLNELNDQYHGLEKQRNKQVSKVYDAREKYKAAKEELDLMKQGKIVPKKKSSPLGGSSQPQFRVNTGHAGVGSALIGQAQKVAKLKDELEKEEFELEKQLKEQQAVEANLKKMIPAGIENYRPQIKEMLKKQLNPMLDKAMKEKMNEMNKYIGTITDENGDFQGNFGNTPMDGMFNKGYDIRKNGNNNEDTFQDTSNFHYFDLGDYTPLEDEPGVENMFLNGNGP